MSALVITGVLLALLATVVAGITGHLRTVFLLLSALLIALVGIAAVRDSQQRDYLSIQDQYKADYASQDYPSGVAPFDSKIQQLFPTYAEAQQGQTYRVERCISCHVPNIAEIGPQVAAQRLWQDFQKYEPDAQSIASANHLTGNHPVYIDQSYYCQWGQTGNGYNGYLKNAPSPVPAGGRAVAPLCGGTGSSSGASASPSAAASPSSGTAGASASASASPSSSAATGGGSGASNAGGNGAPGQNGTSSTGGSSGTGTTAAGPTPPPAINGYVPPFLAPASSGDKLGIDQVGCIVCHNGGRLELDEQHAHLNLIINPEYAFTEGARLYYSVASCVSCHGANGEGGTGTTAGPPLSNQDRLGFFNEDYYYRCIEFGKTGFEHIGSKMPNWGSIASDFHGSLTDPNNPINTKPVLTETQISILVQFIRHWEDYSTLP